MLPHPQVNLPAEPDRSLLAAKHRRCFSQREGTLGRLPVPLPQIQPQKQSQDRGTPPPQVAHLRVLKRSVIDMGNHECARIDWSSNEECAEQPDPRTLFAQAEQSAGQHFADFARERRTS